MYAGFLMVEISSFITCKISIWLRESPDHEQLQNDMQALMVACPAQYWIGSESYSGTNVVVGGSESPWGHNVARVRIKKVFKLYYYIINNIRTRNE